MKNKINTDFENKSKFDDLSNIDFGESEERNATTISEDSLSDNINVEDVQTTKAFESRLQRAIKKDLILSKLLENVIPIDFALICYGDVVSQIRAELENAKDKEEKEILRNKLERFKPNNQRKYVILIEELSRISENNKIELGLIDTLPFYYTGYHWKEMSDELIGCFLSMVAEKSGIKHEDAFHFKEKEKLFQQFASTSRIPAPVFNFNTVKINLLNGTFVINGDYKGLEKPDPEDLMKYQLPFEYNPKATAPMFHKFLDEVIPEPDKQSLLSEYLGYVFTKGLKLEVALILIGSGANGKSVLHSLVYALLGKDNISTTSLSKLCEPNGYYRLKLGNVLLNYSSEIGSKDCNPDTVKKLISTEPIDARTPHFAPTEITDYCRFMFNANEKPKEIEQTHAFYRRFKFVRFAKTIPLDKQDPDLAQKIIDNGELSGIFNWVLTGLETILKNRKFSFSKSAEEETISYIKDSNTVLVFMEEENYIKSEDGMFVLLTTLYPSYLEYCKKAGLNYPVSRFEFTKRLENAGYFVKRKCTNNGTRVFCKLLERVIENVQSPFPLIANKPSNN